MANEKIDNILNKIEFKVDDIKDDTSVILRKYLSEKIQISKEIKNSFSSQFKQNKELFDDLKKPLESISKDIESFSDFSSNFEKNFKKNLIDPITQGINDSIRSGFQESMSLISSSISEVMGPEVDKMLGISKIMLLPLIGALKNFSVNLLKTMGFFKDEEDPDYSEDVSDIKKSLDSGVKIRQDFSDDDSGEDMVDDISKMRDFLKNDVENSDNIIDISKRILKVVTEMLFMSRKEEIVGAVNFLKPKKPLEEKNIDLTDLCDNKKTDDLGETFTKDIDILRESIKNDFKKYWDGINDQGCEDFSKTSEEIKRKLEEYFSSRMSYDEEMLNIAKRKEKAEQIKKPKKSIWQMIMDLLIGPLLLISGILGMIAAKIMMPYTLLKKAISILGKIDILKDISKYFKNIGLNFVDSLKNGFRSIDKYFNNFFTRMKDGILSTGKNVISNMKTSIIKSFSFVKMSFLSKMMDIKTFLSKWKIGKFLAEKTGTVFKVFSKMFSGVSKFTSGFFRIFSKSFFEVGKVILKSFKLIKGLIPGRLIGAFKFGFKIFGKFIQPILSLIDFIRGFIKTEGNILDKIQGGLSYVIKGLVELPIRLVGWIVDSVLKWLDIEPPKGGTGKIILDTVMKGADIIVNTIMFPLKYIIGFIKSNKKGISDLFKNFGNVIGNFFKFIKNFFIGDFSKAFDNILDVIKNSFKFIKTWLGLVLNFFGIDKIIKWSIDIRDNSIKFVSNSINWFIDKIKGVFSFIENLIKESKKKYIDPILEKIGFKEIINNIQDKIKSIINTITSIWDNIKNFLEEKKQQFLNLPIVKQINNTAKSIVDGSKNLSQDTMEGLGKVKSGVYESKEKIKEGTSDLSKDVKNGLSEVKRGLIESLRSVFDKDQIKSINSLKRAADIYNKQTIGVSGGFINPVSEMKRAADTYNKQTNINLDIITKKPKLAENVDVGKIEEERVKIELKRSSELYFKQTKQKPVENRIVSNNGNVINNNYTLTDNKEITLTKFSYA